MLLKRTRRRSGRVYYNMRGRSNVVIVVVTSFGCVSVS
jgi:hypothetical protein